MPFSIILFLAGIGIGAVSYALIHLFTRLKENSHPPELLNKGYINVYGDGEYLAPKNPISLYSGIVSDLEIFDNDQLQVVLRDLILDVLHQEGELSLTLICQVIKILTDSDDPVFTMLPLHFLVEAGFILGPDPYDIRNIDPDETLYSINRN